MAFKKEMKECIGCQKLVQVEVSSDVKKYFVVCDVCEDGDIIFRIACPKGSAYVTEWRG